MITKTSDNVAEILRSFEIINCIDGDNVTANIKIGCGRKNENQIVLIKLHVAKKEHVESSLLQKEN